MAAYDYNDSPAPAPTPDPREAVQEALRAIRRNVVRVVFTTLVMLMVGYALTLVWPNKYASSTEFVLRQSQIMSEAMRDELREVPLPKKLKTLESELQSRRRIDSVMDELGWVEWLETAESEARRRSLVEKIKDNLTVEMDTDAIGAHHITLAFQWTQPHKAADFVNHLRDHWITLTLDNRRRMLEEHKERLEAVVVEREAAYAAALRARQKFEQEHNVPRLLTPEINNTIKGELLTQIPVAKAELDNAINRVERIEGELQTIPRTISMPVAPANPAVAQALAAFQQAKANFESKKADYTPRNPIYIKAEIELREAQEALEQVGGADAAVIEKTEQTNPTYYEKVQEWELAREEETKWRAQVSRLEEELDAVQARLDKMPIVNERMHELNYEVQTSSKLLEEAKLEVQPVRDQVQQLRTRQTLTTGDSGLLSAGPFEILETGVEPEDAVLPIGAVIMALSLILGVTLGIAGPILGELTRTSYGSVKEVSRTLGVPVLGAVDLILTPRDVRARFVQQALTITTMVLVLLALGTALYIYTNLPDVLPASLHNFVRDMKLALT